MRPLYVLFPMLFLTACGSSSATISPDHIDDGGAPLADAGSPSPDGGSNPPGPGDVTNGSRLHGITITGEDGSKMTMAGTWRDTQLDVDCSFGKAGDGRLRCLPQGNAIAYEAGLYYSDPTCSTAVALSPKAFCQGEPPKFASMAFTAACGQGARFFPVTGPYAGQVYFKYSSGCGAADPSSTQAYYFFSIGAESAPASFVGGTRD